MSLNPSRPKFTPRIVIHGGAGNITRQNLTPSARHTYLASIASILHHIHPLLSTGALTAAEAATLAVKLLEDNPLFNCARGAVFTLDGHIELEASLMISRGSFKRCAGVYLLKGVKNPILLARELLSRDGGGGDRERGEGHNCLSGAYAEGLAEKWGLEVVNEEYFWTRKRWEQHLADLKDGERKGGKMVKNMMFLDGEVLSRYSEKNSANSSYDGRTMDDDDEKWKGEEEEYLPKGTVGCVVLDADGVIAVATSTGGRTNKVPGRIGDTPTPGAGFWAEEWDAPPELRKRSRLRSLFSCLPFLNTSSSQTASTSLSISTKKAAGLSGTGNGDYFLRLAACHSIISLFKHTNTTLSSAAKKIVGPNGEMQKAAEGRKGEDFSGAVVGVDGEGNVIMEMNCGGCFRGTVDERGRVLVAAFADEELEVWREFNKVEG